MKGSIISWLLLAISTISIFSDVAATSASAKCLGADQSSLLLELRHSLVFNTSASTKLVRWGRSANSWSGVTCEDGLLVGLDLSEEWISGGINRSSSLFRLKFLRSLNLAFNHLSYSMIPSGFANLSHLVHLNLSNAPFSGQISAELSRLTKLRKLDLSAIHFSECDPLKLEKPSLRSLIRDMGELRELYLNEVDLSVEGSEWCNALSSSVPKLEVLSMSHCSLSGPIDASLLSLANLSVIRLNLNDLSTTVPSILANFSSLKTLSLHNCDLKGEFPQKHTINFFRLPDSIGNLRKLSMLDLHNCSLSGSIPTSMENLSELTYLDLSSNNLTGSLPSYGASRNLTQIYLFDNALTGQITSVGWEDLLNLEYLYLRNNSLEGDIPSTLFTLPRLEEIYLSNNKFSGQLIINPNVSSNRLESLDLSSNLLQGSIPRWIWKLRNLAYLNLSSNFFEDLETPLCNLTPTLLYVDLHSSMHRGNMLPLPSQAICLDFSSNNITSVFSDNIGNYLSSSTMFFSLSMNNFHGSIPKSICKATYSMHLEVLDLSHNLLNGTIPNCLMKASLKVLNLRNNQLSGNIPQNISTTCGLKTLDLSENLLQGQIPLSLANCTTLEILNIGNNQIDGTFPCHFMAISSLRVLILRSNKLHGEIGCAHSPFTWQMLQIIDLSSNDLSGTLPASLLASWEAMKAEVDFNYLQYELYIRGGYYYQDTVSVTIKGLEQKLTKILTIFTSIDFSGNRFEGQIPNTLGDLKALYSLNLSHNAISGSIPPILGNLLQLESLDLSWNHLNGTIPAHLANLDLLSFLNLSNNQLVGSIPDSGHFLTFSKSAFERNLGLCGLQLNKSCSIAMNKTKEAGDDGNNDDNKKKWFFLGIPLGFVVGFWVFCGPLVFIRSWRFAYYRFWDKVLF
ncbi:hypothetical protein BT93_E0569 [Corymbia citriodora subsp. variegata]|nr:hypothetical protein BT93_E0569 [Corymbia citriodora subsp. variegata]